jgi:hypothetical protein
MSRFPVVGAFVAVSVLCGQACGESPTDKAKMIPLEKIWAYDMPGTKDVRELEPKLDVHDPGFQEFWRQSLVRRIVRFLAVYTPKEGETAGPSFVVVGKGKGALNKVLDTLKDRERKKQERPFPKDWELSLVFYSYVTGWHPQIKSVEQTPALITVKYQFVAQQEPAFAAVRFALIPIGKFPAGKVRVKIEEVPPVDFKGKPVDPLQHAERYVCGSSSFTIK